MNVPDAPTFRPTKEEWSNPLTYIQSIRAQAQLYGICKIIPPDGWRPTVTGLDKLRFVTKKQRIDLLQWRDFDAAKVEFYTRLVLFWQHEWRRHVQQQKRKRPTSTSASTTSASAAAPSPDERNFTFSGVKLVDGEIVNPRLTSCTLSGDLDVDLFLLYELVRTQWGGYTAVGKANGWSEVVKKMRTAALICHTNHVFQRNDENPFTWQQGQSQSSGRGRGRQQARQESPISAPDDMSTGTLTAAAKELAKVYKTYLLPYEHYERSFVQQCQQHMGDIATDATATSTNSAASSPASSSAAIASSTSPSPPPPASSSMHPPSVPWTNSKRPVHLLTPGAPHPYLSVNELNKWQNINHVHQLQSKRADTPMNDDESTPTEASIDEESKMCQKCTMRLDDLSSVCYACRKGQHHKDCRRCRPDQGEVRTTSSLLSDSVLCMIVCSFCQVITGIVSLPHFNLLHCLPGTVLHALLQLDHSEPVERMISHPMRRKLSSLNMTGLRNANQNAHSPPVPMPHPSQAPSTQRRAVHASVPFVHLTSSLTIGQSLRVVSMIHLLRLSMDRILVGMASMAAVHSLRRVHTHALIGI